LSLRQVKKNGFLRELGLKNKSIAARQNIEKRQLEELNNSVNQVYQNSDKPGLQSSPVEEPVYIEFEPVDTLKTIAEETGTSRDTVSKAIKIVKKAPEETVKKVRSGEMSINQVYTDHQTVKNAEKFADAVDKVA
jgi:hypothetical protein